MFNRERKKYPPAEYFSGQELIVAKAIYDGDKKQLARVLESGRDINTVGQGGLSYLMYAIYIEDYGMTEFLLEKGADPNLLSPLMITKRNSRRDEKDRRPQNLLPLETCCQHYPIKWMKLLIKHGADLNDNRASTPLHAAVMSGNKMEKVKYLLDCGADINQTDKSDTPIMTAADIMDWSMVNYLLDRGADVHHVNRNGYSLGLDLQEYAARDVWTPEGRKQIEDLINRLKEKGVEFPVTKQEPAPADQTDNRQAEASPSFEPRSSISDACLTTVETYPSGSVHDL